ncbi:protein-glutamine gamma-glutamyltransferase [Fictibacillus nanhaiensis]|uniref:protein-glutamine gamma-glutamyltransferase n=1 Tax=Fictibacillus nanhaiensis TaxID=742169 RepID=UPI001C9631D7|nr:protein-glutamine gamma-glutamyltransferase [Fictibacillus nanhaiensis]MBY6036782.1 protein-glutamine gamma-glutamyltransferase [Fictibacillus nanhaiensis]
MIFVNGYSVDTAQISGFDRLTSAQKQIGEKLKNSRESFYYSSPHQFLFEVVMRSNIVAAAYAMRDSGAGFATFVNSRCNPQYWRRTAYGGFLLRPGVPPSDAITDIFINGKKYGFECTTAIMIMLYKAVLESIGTKMFNQLFNGLLLYSTEHDEDLQIIAAPSGDSLPGDVRYIKNPEHHPNTPQWQGENVVDLGNGKVFGHGIGTGTIGEIIDVLNTKRMPGATVSAYLTSEIIRPHYRLMAEYTRHPVRRLLGGAI